MGQTIKPKITLDNVDQSVFGEILASITALSNRISSVETIENDIKYIKEHAEEQKKCSVELIDILKGNGGRGEVGLIGRVKKLEDWVERREWFEKVIIVAVATNIIGLGFVIAKLLMKI